MTTPCLLMGLFNVRFGRKFNASLVLIIAILFETNARWEYFDIKVCCGSLLELLSHVEIIVCDVCESFLLNKGALVAQINDLHF